MDELDAEFLQVYFKGAILSISRGQIVPVALLYSANSTCWKSAKVLCKLRLFQAHSSYNRPTRATIVSVRFIPNPPSKSMAIHNHSTQQTLQHPLSNPTPYAEHCEYEPGNSKWKQFGLYDLPCNHLTEFQFTTGVILAKKIKKTRRILFEIWAIDYMGWSSRPF